MLSRLRAFFAILLVYSLVAPSFANDSAEKESSGKSTVTQCILSALNALKTGSRSVVEPVPGIEKGVYVAWYPINTHMKLFVEGKVVETAWKYKRVGGSRGAQTLVRIARKGQRLGDSVGAVVLFEIKADEKQILKMKSFMEREAKKGAFALLLQDCSAGACKAVRAGTGGLKGLPLPVAGVPVLAAAYLTALRLFPGSVVKSIQVVGEPGAKKWAQIMLGPLLGGGDWAAAAGYLGVPALVLYGIKMSVHDSITQDDQEVEVLVTKTSEEPSQSETEENHSSFIKH